MRFLTKTLNDVVGAFGLELEPWMAPLFAVCIALLVLPAYRKNFHTKKARKKVQAASVSGGEERKQLERESFELVDGNPFGLMVVAEEAHKRGMRPLAERALRALDATGKRRVEAKALRIKLGLERAITAEGEAVAIENLLDAGLVERAAERLEAAERAFPGHEALHGLRERTQ